MSAASAAALRVTTLAQGWTDDRPGGMNRYVADLHAGFTAQGVDDRLVVFGPAASAPDGVHRAGLETAPLLSRVVSLTRAALAVSGDSDVLATHFALYGTLPALALRGLRRARRRRPVPLVAHFHGPWAGESAAAGAGGVSTRVKATVEGTHVRSAAAVVTASRAFADLAVATHGLSAARVHAIHPGVDLDRFSPLPEAERARLRARMGIAAGEVVALTVRRLVPRMGLDVLLRAWPDLPGTRLVVVGDGPARPGLEAQAREAGLRGVRFTGRVEDDDLVGWYRAADVVVVPSVALEGFGLVVLEALACGTPVLASDLGGLAEVLPGLADGLLVPPGDVRAWRERLDAALVGGLPGRTACRALATRHGLEQFADAVAAVYRNAVQEVR